MRTSFSATEQDAIRRDHRAMETAGVSMVDLLQDFLDSVNEAAIGITALAGDIDSLALGGGHAAQDPDTTSGLTFGYKAFRFGNGLINVTVVAGTLVLPSSQTNYVEVDRAGTVSFNTSGFTSGRLPLWTIVTGASAIATVTISKPLLQLIGLAGVVGTMLSTSAKTKTIEISLGDVAATANFSLICPGLAATVAAVRFVTKTAVTADDTNYWTFKLLNKGAAGSATTKIVDETVAANSTKATGGSGQTAYVKRVLTLSTTPADLDVAAADVLEFTLSKAASATTMQQCTLQIDFTFTG
jgi:hypothetical protein